MKTKDETMQAIAVATTALDEATRNRDTAIRHAIEAGHPIRQIALTAGLSRQTIYTIKGRV